MVRDTRFVRHDCLIIVCFIAPFANSNPYRMVDNRASFNHYCCPPRTFFQNRTQSLKKYRPAQKFWQLLGGSVFS